MHAKVFAISLILMAFFVASTTRLSAQTTEFTFQGSLKDGANAANGNYDFEFALFDALSAGTQLGSTLPRNGVAVANGVFSVKLDFGAQFTGANRFLEIRVRPAGGGAFTPLTPRQQISNEPYSVRSLNSTNADTAANATQLGGVAAANYLQTNGNGSGLTNLNAANISTGTLAVSRGGTGSATQNFVDLSTDQTGIGGNKTFLGDLRVNGNFGIGTAPGVTAPGSVLDVAGRTRLRQNPGFTGSVLAAGLWLYQNNSASDRAFIGMTDDNYVGLTGNGVASSVLLLNTLTGNVGVGTASPQQRLSVADGVNIDQNSLNSGTITNTLRFGTGNSGEAIGSKRTAGGNQFGLDFWTASANRMSITVAGNVGIGTTAPAGNFHINVPGGGNPISAMTLDVGTFGTGANALNSYYFKARDLGAGNTSVFLIRGDGNVGIGTNTPTQKLDVSGTGVIRANVNSDSNGGLSLSLNNTSKWSLATVSPGQFQIYNQTLNSNAVWIDPATNNVGIGSTTPAATLEVNGYSKLGSDAPAIRMKKLTGTTAAAEGGGVDIPHGLDASKILSVSVMVFDTLNTWRAPNYTFVIGRHFQWYLDSANITIINMPGGSANLLSRPIKILITYEQ